MEFIHSSHDFNTGWCDYVIELDTVSRKKGTWLCYRNDQDDDNTIDDDDDDDNNEAILMTPTKIQWQNIGLYASYLYNVVLTARPADY